ncbi:MAG TPA: thioredoxin domain-containing protein [Solirubrobacterales bacterium]|jgi:protein-disulfide isomerase
MSAEASGTLAPVDEGDHVLGAEQPELTLVEYGDFGCPSCFAARRPLESLLDRYDTLRLVWRHLPDTDLHPGADLAAELSELAADNGRFWDAHSMLLSGRESFTPQDLLSVATRLDLDAEEAEAALVARTYRRRIVDDVAGAERAGAHGTPSFFIDGERLEGPWRQLAQVVPERLEERRA